MLSGEDASLTLEEFFSDDVEIERRVKQIEDGTAELLPAEEVFRELSSK